MPRVKGLTNKQNRTRRGYTPTGLRPGTRQTSTWEAVMTWRWRQGEMRKRWLGHRRLGQGQLQSTPKRMLQVLAPHFIHVACSASCTSMQSQRTVPIYLYDMFSRLGNFGSTGQEQCRLVESGLLNVLQAVDDYLAEKRGDPSATGRYRYTLSKCQPTIADCFIYRDRGPIPTLHQQDFEQACQVICRRRWPQEETQSQPRYLPLHAIHEAGVVGYWAS